MKHIATLCILTILCTTLKAELPNFSQEATPLSPGLLTLDFGVIYRDNPRDFGLPPRRKQWEYGFSRLSVGLGRYAELQIQGAVVTRAQGQDGEWDSTSGDWILGTKIFLLSQKKYRPALSFYYNAKMPNGSDESGAATDETDFNTYLLADKDLADNFRVTANIGLGILGDPFSNSSQNDVLHYSLTGTYKIEDKHFMSLEWGGQTGPEVRDDSRSLFLNYSRRLNKKWFVYVAAAKGFGDDTDDWAGLVGARRMFRLKAPNPPSRDFYGY